MSLSTSEVSSGPSPKNIFKKILIVFTALVGLFVVAAVTVPFFVDVDKYRPQILEKVNSEINGRLEIGKLSLSLWGRVYVGIDGLKLADTSSRAAVQVKDASLNLPFWSLLTGRPELRLQMNSPLIHIVKEKDGKLNLLKIAKTGDAKSVKVTTEKDGADKTVGSDPRVGETKLPGFVLNSRLTVLLTNATVSYEDLLTNDKYQIDDLNFAVRDVSPSSEMPFEISAVLDVAMKNGTKISGPVSLSGLVKAESSANSFEKARFSATVKADEANITYGEFFAKGPGVALNLNAEGNATPDSVQVSSYKLQLADIAVAGTATVETSSSTTRLFATVDTGVVQLASLASVSPFAKTYNLAGQLELDTKVSGPVSSIDYEGTAKLSSVVLRSENMKQPLDLDADIAFATDQLKSLTAKVTAKDFDLGITGNLQNFSAPKFRFIAKSAILDVDSLLKSTSAAAERRAVSVKENGTTGQSTAPAKGTPVVDYNAMFEPLRGNKVAAAANGTVSFDLKRIKATGVVLENTQGEILLNQLLLELKNFSTKVFDGTISGTASFNARSAKPEVGTNISVANLQTKKMVERQMPFARNAVQGVLSAKLNIGGSGLNPTDVTSSWRGSGSFGVKEAVFSTLDLGKQIKSGVLEKLPDMLRSRIKVPDRLLDWKGEYQTVDVKYSLANGVLNVADITGKAYPNKGLDAKGSGKVILSNYALDLGVDFIDTYNWLNAEQFVRDERYGRFALPAKIGGTLFAPKFDWGTALGKLVQSAAKQQAKEAVKKGVLDKIKIPGGSNGEKPADAAKGILKGIFGR